MLLLLDVVCPIIGSNRNNRDILDSNNHSAFFLKIATLYTYICSYM